uniref:Adhesin n=1 Tax=Rhabditophanes sp. KR3021 TaxID=114890 RepID=A0AC35UBX9_9BILA
MKFISNCILLVALSGYSILAQQMNIPEQVNDGGVMQGDGEAIKQLPRFRRLSGMEEKRNQNNGQSQDTVINTKIETIQPLGEIKQSETSITVTRPLENKMERDADILIEKTVRVERQLNAGANVNLGRGKRSTELTEENGRYIQARVERQLNAGANVNLGRGKRDAESAIKNGNVKSTVHENTRIERRQVNAGINLNARGKRDANFLRQNKQQTFDSSRYIRQVAIGVAPAVSAVSVPVITPSITAVGPISRVQRDTHEIDTQLNVDHDDAETKIEKQNTKRSPADKEDQKVAKQYIAGDRPTTEIIDRHDAQFKSQ